MKILSLTHWDFGGCGYFLCDAINRYTAHECRAVRLHSPDEAYIKFPHDLAAPSNAQVVELFRWCDVVHVHDINPYSKFLPMDTKPVVRSYNGSIYRRRHKRLDAEDRERGRLSAVTTLNLLLYSGQPRWLPCCRPDLSDYADRPKAPGFHVVQAPTKREGKQTNEVIPILESLADEGITFEIIERVSWRECLERKSRAHLLIDQFDTGIGCNATEAWMMGIPVIANCPSAVKDEFRQRVGYVPFTASSLDDLRDTILRLKRDRVFYWNELTRGARYAKQWHSQRAVALRAVALYREVLGTRAEAEAVSAADVGRRGMVLLEYVGRSMGLQQFWGPETGQVYRFGGKRRTGYVDARDVPDFLNLARGRGKPEFRRAEKL